MTEKWEEGFDRWTPRTPPTRDDDTGIDLDREALLSLARELADRRRAQHRQTDDELEQLKQSLRERAAAVAARERELSELERRLGAKGGAGAKHPAVDSDALVARERAALERAQALDARERELLARAAELEAESDELALREQALEAEFARVRAQLEESRSERELASAERAQLEARADEARRVEKDLAARRVELRQERELLDARAAELESRARTLAHRDDPAPAIPSGREDELRELEARLEARERELALIRQGLDAERNSLLERERAIRRREIAEVRQSFGAPLAAPGFSEGLASFVASRGRR
jgi:uncharacterized protein (DUF3084 family)